MEYQTPELLRSPLRVVRHSMVGGWGRDRVGGRFYTPLYQNGIKEVRIKSTETTKGTTMF